jgi:hypothetical protein
MISRFLVLSVAALFSSSLFAQVNPFPVFNTAPAGVKIDANGTISARETDTSSELAAQRLRGRAMNQPPKNQDLTYVSLSRLFAEVKSLTEQKKEIPDSVRYLSGLTQIRYVFVFPEEHDLIIAGPSEEFDASHNKAEPTGKLTGRPVMHLDDLITALRCGAGAQQKPFGCSIDPTPDALNRCNAIMKEMAGATRGARMNAMKEAIGLQKVSLFGTPADSRTTFITVAADYKLKRMCLGLDPIPVPGVGSPVDNSKATSNRFWFEANYAPLLVSVDGNAYELRGPRLILKAGAFSFDEKGGTETAKRFAKNFTAKIPQLATVTPLYADLQNVADMSVVAALIRKDDLARKSGLDISWVLSESNYATARFPTLLTAETVVNYTNGSIVAGGVTLDPNKVVSSTNREQDEKETLKLAKARPVGDNWSKTKSAEEIKRQTSAK